MSERVWCDPGFAVAANAHDAQACVLCGATHIAHGPVVNRVARNGYPQTSVACPRCKLVQAVPMPGAEELRRYYEDGSYRREFPPLAVELDGVLVAPSSEHYEAACDAQAKASAEWLATTLQMVPGEAPLAPGTKPTPTFVHEIGCGEGRVAAALAKAGYGVTAWDEDPAMRAEAEKRDVWMRESGRGRDLVYALQVLEHCVDPVATLREWRAMLAPTGRVHVQVPTLEAMYGGASHFFQRPHVVNFTRRTLTMALLRAGLVPEHVAVTGNILWATATVGEEWSWERVRSALATRPQDDPAALIAAHEAQMAATREEPRWPALEEWDTWGGAVDCYECGFGAEEARELADLRAHVARQQDALRMLAESMHAEAERLSKEWSADPWAWGYLCGKVRQTKTVAQAVTHIANAAWRRGR